MRPAKFTNEREAKPANVSKAALKAAMDRLLDSGRIRTERTRPSVVAPARPMARRGAMRPVAYRSHIGRIWVCYIP